MMNKTNYINAREEYIERLKAELLGPGSEVSIPDAEHELISDAPEKRYSIGVLFAQESKMCIDNDDMDPESSSTEPEEEITVEEPLGQELDDDSDSNESNYKGSRKASGDNDEGNTLDEVISLSAQNKPSSFGLTFFIKGQADKIACKISYATYRRASVKECKVPFSISDIEGFSLDAPFSEYFLLDKERECLLLKGKGDFSSSKVTAWKDKGLFKDLHWLKDAAYKLADQMAGAYIREPSETCDYLIDFDDNDYYENVIEEKSAKVEITAVRREIEENLYSITIMLVNGSHDRASFTSCLLQPQLSISSSSNEFVFSPIERTTDFSAMDLEEQSLELQYRNKKNYGIGLGCAVDWKIDDNGVGHVKTTFFPEVEIPTMDFNIPQESKIENDALSMKYLSDLCMDEKALKIKKLNTIVSAYEKWIFEVNEKSKKLEDKYAEISKENIKGCLNSLNRMKNGIRLLEDNPLVWNAFELANRSMFMQRVHLNLQAELSTQDRYPGDPEVSEKMSKINYSIEKDIYHWRTFQIAFILMSLNSMVDETCEERDLVDLIWFPTGGGKTEAYLGLTAFTIFYRRLRYPEEADGTTVIMRYTLRLLTAQQFTRAATLICACEYIRYDSNRKKNKYPKYDLGKKRISIGLWIGGSHTPNKNSDARNCWKKLNEAKAYNIDNTKDRYNKFQVLKCPWCGTKLVKDKAENNKLKGEFGYRMENNSHFKMFCPREDCFFNEDEDSLPIQIVDQELYADPPTLLFGTVDKFAMLPWKKEVGSFFGEGTNNRPPELIIQDELHLISGPLGSMVGLYESVVDALCSNNEHKTKIIASTATIRRAKEQCAALYNRHVAQFPHPGIDAEDSFFARESHIDLDQGRYGRKYIGLMPSGKTKAMMEVRTMASLLQIINEMEIPDEIKDKYWTLTTYFNNLKELGKSTTLVADDVKDFIKRKAYRSGTNKHTRLIGSADELTSRISTSELNITLDKLEKLTYSKENIAKKKYASNVLLATNMISVGIDVARLNVMLIVGQPKLTSEYIQASSRIGRSFPGVAFTMYDAGRSRDRSYFEQFKSYHEAFYKHVEPTGITPFSEPARDRALHAVLIALMRHICPELSEESAAALFSTEKYSDEVNRIEEYLIRRNNSIRSETNKDMIDDTSSLEREMDDVFERWESLAEYYGEESFTYGNKYMVKNPEDGEGRLMKVYNTAYNDSAFDTMTSMRSVDAVVKSNVLIWGDEQ